MIQKFFTAGFVMTALGLSAQETLVINELMQSNIDCIVDDLNDFPDSWVELYSPTGKTLSLEGYAIGTSTKIKKLYSLPAMDVAPGEFVIIYCDKAETGLHTSFRLESNKEGALYLFKDGEIVDALESIAPQPSPNVAYGRRNESSGTWGYQEIPTPGKKNCGKIYDQVRQTYGEIRGIITVILNLIEASGVA